MMTVCRYTDCHNVTYKTQSEVADSNTSLSMQTTAKNFTVENKTVSMLQHTTTCSYDIFVFCFKYRLKVTLASQ